MRLFDEGVVERKCLAQPEKSSPKMMGCEMRRAVCWTRQGQGMMCLDSGLKDQQATVSVGVEIKEIMVLRASDDSATAGCRLETTRLVKLESAQSNVTVSVLCDVGTPDTGLRKALRSVPSPRLLHTQPNHHLLFVSPPALSNVITESNVRGQKTGHCRVIAEELPDSPVMRSANLEVAVVALVGGVSGATVATATSIAPACTGDFNPEDSISIHQLEGDLTEKSSVTASANAFVLFHIHLEPALTPETAL
ncbi:hypothetical protein F5887DRAFT_1174674 [Amanita rubescens]|nr:hypothetical protein F5887DRAFT_1174674 [Amanita rubescens]